MSRHPWWYVARGFGLVAWVALAASMLAGVALSYRRTRSAPAALDAHRFLGVLAVLLTGVHLAALVADGFVSFGVVQVLVPFRSAWRPGPVAWGIVAMYLLLLVEATSVAARTMSRHRWRRLHNLSYPCFAAATIHLASAGSDIARWVPQWVVIVSVSTVIVACFVGAERAERGLRTADVAD